MNTLVVNLFAGPGTGKSTGAAYIFSKLKLKNVNCELVTEVAKDLVWEEDHTALADQFYICGNQIHRIFRCIDKVDVIITDSPILLQNLYGQTTNAFKEAILEEFNKYNNLNYFLKRQKPYNPKGRLQDENEAKELDTEIKNILDKNQIKYNEVKANEDGYEAIISKIVEYLS